MWLVPQVAKMKRILPLGIFRVVRPKNTKQHGHKISPLLVKLVRSRRLDIGIVLFVFIDHDWVLVDKYAKKKNWTNMQPS